MFIKAGATITLTSYILLSVFAYDTSYPIVCVLVSTFGFGAIGTFPFSCASLEEISYPVSENTG